MMNVTPLEADPSDEQWAPSPMKLFIEMTSACNLRCPHCYVSAGEGKVRQLPSRLVHALLREFVELGGWSVTLSGGEPTIHRGWQAALRYAAYMGLDTCLLTNGTRLLPSDLDLLAELGTRVAVSLDGADAPVHDAIRGEGMFDRTMQAIEELVARGMGPNITICFTPMAGTYRQLPRVAALARSLEIPTVYVSLLEDRGRASGDIQRLGLSDDERTQLLFAIVSLMERYPELLLDCPNLRMFPERLLGQGVDAEELDRTIRVTADGDAYLSAYLEDPVFRLGTYQPGNLSGLWRDGRVQEHLRTAEERRGRLRACHACPAWDLCRGGSAAMAWAEHGSFESVDSFCSAKRRIVGSVVGVG